MEGDEGTQICPNCNREIPKVNFVTHSVHCVRNIKICPSCKEPVLQSELDEHNDKLHQLVPCEQCGEMVRGTDMEDHVRDSCDFTMQSCRYCTLELRRREVPPHERYCGARTERCAECGEYVMLRYRQVHLDSNHGFVRLREDSPPRPEMRAPAEPTQIRPAAVSRPRFPPYVPISDLVRPNINREESLRLIAEFRARQTENEDTAKVSDEELRFKMLATVPITLPNREDPLRGDFGYSRLKEREKLIANLRGRTRVRRPLTLEEIEEFRNRLNQNVIIPVRNFGLNPIPPGPRVVRRRPFRDSVVVRREIAPNAEGQNANAQNDNLQNDNPQNENPQNEDSQNKNPQNDNTQNDNTQNENPQNEITQNENPQTNNTQNENPQNGTPQNENPQNESTQNESTQNESTQNESTQNESTQNESTQNESTQNENPQYENADSHNADAQNTNAQSTNIQNTSAPNSNQQNTNVQNVNPQNENVQNVEAQDAEVPIAVMPDVETEETVAGDPGTMLADAEEVSMKAKIDEESDSEEVAETPRPQSSTSSRIHLNYRIILKRTNDQPQINTAVTAQDKLVKKLGTRGAVKKRPAPAAPPSSAASSASTSSAVPVGAAPAVPAAPAQPAAPSTPAAPAQPNPRRDLSYYSALQRRQDEDRRRREQSAYNLANGLPPVLDPAAKLEKLRKMDALLNRDDEPPDHRERLQGRVWRDNNNAPVGHTLGRGPTNTDTNARTASLPQVTDLERQRRQLADLQPMSPEEFMERFNELQLIKEPRDIRSSLRELRRGLNEVTAPYNNANNNNNNNNNNTNKNNNIIEKELNKILKNIVPEIDQLDEARAPSPEDVVMVPCEFCFEQLQAQHLLDHERVCREGLSRARGLTATPTPPTTPSPPSRPQSPWADDDIPVIPCEFCTEALPLYLINEHQELCGRDAQLLYPD